MEITSHENNVLIGPFFLLINFVRLNHTPYRDIFGKKKKHLQISKLLHPPTSLGKHHIVFFYKKSASARKKYNTFLSTKLKQRNKISP